MRNKAELILHPNGAVYHLNLLPHQVAPTFITVGDPARVPSVSKYFDHIDFKKEYREFTTHTGRIGKRAVTVVSTGMGLDNIDIFMNEMDALLNIDLKTGMPKNNLQRATFIRLGTSGAVHSNVALDSVLLSRKAYTLDALFAYYPEAQNFREGELHGLPLYAFAADESLCSTFPERDFAMGNTLTLPGFYAPQGRSLRLGQNGKSMLESLAHLPIHNLEMETAGLYGFGQMLGHRVVSCNAIIAHRLQNRFSTQPEKTVERMIANVLSLIESGVL